jgi:chromosome segregation ATPase
VTSRSRSPLPRRRIVLGASLLALCALAGCEPDPAKGGILGGLNGIFTGAYDQRLQVRQQQLGAAQEQGAYLEASNARLGHEAEQTASTRATLYHRLATLDAQTKALDEQTGQIATDTEAKRQKRAALAEQLGEVHADLDRLGRDLDTNGESAAAAERQRAALEQKLKDLKIVADAMQ